MRWRNLVLGDLGVLAVGRAASVSMAIMRQADAPLGFIADPASLERARTMLRDNPAIDIHAHPGRTFVRGAHDLSAELWAYSARGAFEAQAIEDMRKGPVPTRRPSGARWAGAGHDVPPDNLADSAWR